MKRYAVLIVAVLLCLALAVPAAAWFQLYDFNSFKLGATWFGQSVQIVTTPGSKWYGSRFLYNDPSKFFVPFDPFAPGGLGAGGEGYPPFALGPDKDGTPWRMVMLPGPPPGGDQPNVYWNYFDWPEDAKHQYVAQVTFGQYVRVAVPNRFYAAPPGAPCHPLYKHLCR